MKNYLFIPLFCILSVACKPKAVQDAEILRAPAYPLVTIDPNTSAWSTTDNLYDSHVQHWTGKEFPLLGAITVDGQAYRFMGVEEPLMKVVLADASQQKWTGVYTTTEPEGNWQEENYNTTSWKRGKAAFSSSDDGTMGTEWTSEHIWVRRQFKLEEDLSNEDLYLLITNDDDAEFYVNGHLVISTGFNCNHYKPVKMPAEAAASLHEGINTIAVHCWNRGGLAALDCGIVKKEDVAEKFSTAATQTSARVEAMNTYYTFDCGAVTLELTFTAPMFMDDLDLLSRPVNYISYEVESSDKAQHEVSVHFEASSVWAVDQPYQSTVSQTYRQGSLVYCKSGSESQKILGNSGDDRRIDWGYFYLAADNSWSEEILDNGYLSLTKDLGSIAEGSGMIMIGYDDLYSIQYFGTNLRPYWNRSGNKSIESQFEAAYSEYGQLMTRSREFDSELSTQACERGGHRYAELCALAYRQAIAAHKLVESPSGELLWLSKENNSNGCIGTVDVTYPSAPLFLIYNPELAKGLLNHIFEYSESGRWTKPFPAHDVGTYPLANGQKYSEDMPVEEAGNMLTLTLATALAADDTDYIRKHWTVLTTWVEYLSQFGLDPDNQLCTDDFAGHLAHNVNLSAKAIMGIASYARMAGMMGDVQNSEKYFGMAREMAAQWMEMSSCGDHYSLTFDRKDTWSQKYNLVWDKLLGLNVFPADVMDMEIKYYLGLQNEYGLPLDSRRSYTKTDWIIWTASMAKDRETFEKFIDPIYKFMNETVDRVPMSDWIETENNRHVGFKARSVVGGYFIPLMKNL